MAVINDTRQLTKLAKWYKPSRYLDIKKASTQHIANELFARYAVWVNLQNGVQSCGEYDELFSERATFNNEPEFPDCDDENVKPLSSIAVQFMAEHIKNKKNIEFTEYHEVGGSTSLAFDGEGFCAGISLSYATDNEILEELKRLLPKMRTQLNIKQPARFRTFEKFENLFSCGVFEYLDLVMWAKLNGHKIYPDFLSKVIRNGKFEPEVIRGKVKRNSEHVMSFDYQEQLRAEIKNSKL